jgi:hypothetical protein
MVCHEITPDATLGRSASDLLDLAVLLNIRRRGYEERFFFEYMERCSQDVAPSPRLSGNREHFLLGREKTIPTFIPIKEEPHRCAALADRSKDDFV